MFAFRPSYDPFFRSNYYYRDPLSELAYALPMLDTDSDESDDGMFDVCENCGLPAHTIAVPTRSRIRQVPLKVKKQQQQKQQQKQQQQLQQQQQQQQQQLQQALAPSTAVTTAPQPSSLVALPPEFEKPLTFDVKREPTRAVVLAELPGVKPSDIQLSAENGVLRLAVTRQHAGQGPFRFEETFVRSLPLPVGLNPEQITAQFKDGKLEVVIPTPPSAQPKKINIAATAQQQEQTDANKVTEASKSSSEAECVTAPAPNPALATASA